MNTYSIPEIEAIFKACSTFVEVEAACQAFHYLIRHNYQQRSDDLERISLTRLQQIIKPNGKA